MNPKKLFHSLFPFYFLFIRFYGIAILLLIIIYSSCSKTTAINQANFTLDEEAPQFLTFPKDIIDTCRGDFDYGTPEVSDNSGEVHLTYVDDSDGDCETGIFIKRIWSAIDRSGNQNTRIQRIELAGREKIKDKEEEPPVLDDKLYLLPNSDFTMLKLKFRMEKGAPIKATIYDLEGTEMYQIEEDLPRGQVCKKIDISNYEAGTYIVMVSHNGLWLSRQFIKGTQ